MSYDSNRKADIFVVTEGPTDQAPRTANESSVTKPHRASTPQTDAARIAEARLRAIEHSRATNAPGAQYGFQHGEGYYKDGSTGPETSYWDARRFVFVAELLETPILKCSKFIWQNDHYDARTGMFNLSDAPAVSIQELKSAIDARIIELGLSKPLIWEWMSVPHPDDDFGRAIWAEDFVTRISRFRGSN